MSDAFSYVFYVFSKIVSFMFSQDLEISYGDDTVPIGYVFIAISVLSLVIGAILSFSAGRAAVEGRGSAHHAIDHMAHGVNKHFRG